jgi:hypothetical protein
MIDTVKLGDLRKLESGTLALTVTETVRREITVELSMADVLEAASGKGDREVLAKVPGLSAMIDEAIASGEVETKKPAKRSLSVYLVEPRR